MKRHSEILNASQVDFYHENGYVVLESHLPQDVIQNIRSEVARIEASAVNLTESNDKLDLEDSHSPGDPRVRRIKLPHTQSDIFKNLMFSDRILAPVRDLIGPDLRLHTSKLNMKSAGYGAAIEWHQDFAFYPHTNDDAVAVAVMIDDMGDENGPLMVFPGSHKGPVFDHHSDGVFSGGVNLQKTGLNPDRAVALMGPSGSISIHHGRILHGSSLNRSAHSRRVLFYEILAADAFPIMGGMTNFGSIAEFDQKILCGKPTIEPRLSPVPVRIPQPQPALNRSIYEIQAGVKKASFAKV